MAISTPPPSGPQALSANTTVSANAPPLQNLGEVVVEVVPARLQLLSRMVYLTGMVVPPAPPSEGEAPAAPNTLILRTQVGEITIRTPAPLPLDKLLTIQIPPGAPPVRAQIYMAMPMVLGAPSPAVAGQLAQATNPLPLPAAGHILAPAAGPMPPPLAAPTAAPLAAPGPILPGLPIGSTPATAPTGAPLNSAAGLGYAMPLLPSSSLSALETAPLLVGMVLRAEVLAAPTLIGAVLSAFRPASPLAPQTDQAVQQLQNTRQPLASFNPQQLADVMRHLPADILMAGEVHSAPALAAPAMPNIVPPHLPSFALTPALLTFPPGSRLIVQVEEIVPPAPTAPPAATPALTTAATLEAAPAVAQASTVATPPVAAGQAPLAASPAANRPIVLGATQAEAQAVPPPVAADSPRMVPALIIGQTPSGAAMATSAAGLIILPDATPLPIGTKVMLSVVEVEEPRPQAKADVAELPPRHWPALQESAALLNVIHPAAHNALQSRLPQPANLGPMTLLFMAALKLGDAAGWLGPVRDQLREGSGGDLFGRINTEFTQQSRAAEATSPEGWKTLTLPLPPDGQLAQLVLHNRREADPANPAEFGQHLLVELELTRLGPLQLDGFIRARSFDLTLRAQRTLPPQLRDELRATFQQALEAVGYKGGLKFETAAQLWLRRS